jgi:Na+/H+-dicarboxylate symporter
MKRWVLNVLAVLVGVTAGLFFMQDYRLFSLLENGVSSFLSLSIFITYTFVAVLAAAGTAGLNLQQLTGKLLRSVLLWALIFSLAAVFTSGFLASLIPPIDYSRLTSEGVQAQRFVQSAEVVRTQIVGLLSRENLAVLYTSFGLLLPIIIASVILGYGITPVREVIRPAYSVINSFSEVAYRLLPGFTHVINVSLAFFSGLFFVHVINLSGWTQISSFLIYFLITIVVFILLVIPLAAVLFARERHPYRLISGLLSPMIIAFVSGSASFALPAALRHTRINLGTAKRVSSTSLPMLTLFGKGGSILVSMFLLVSFHVSVVGGAPAASSLIRISSAVLLFSLFSYAFPGFEVFMITVSSAYLLELVSFGESSTALLLMLYPIMQGTAAMIDTLGSGIGAACSAQILHARIDVGSRERI